MKKLNKILRIIIMIVFVVGLYCVFSSTYSTKASVFTMLGIFIIMFVGQIFHEALHSLASKIILDDWGEVYFGIRKGFFYTSKNMNVKQFIFISIAPFVIMELIFLFFYYYGGKYLFSVIDVRALMLAVWGACVGDLANIICHIVYRNQIKSITLQKPKNIQVEMKDSIQIL